MTAKEKRNENKERGKTVAVPNRAQPWKKLVPFRNEASGASHVDRSFAVVSSLQENKLD